MSKEKFYIAGRSFGSEMKKYAKCTIIASTITLILAAAIQFLWFKYDAILREGWLRISYEGYTAEEEPWIRFFQSPILEKVIPVCCLITLAIVVLYMFYDVLRDVQEGEKSFLSSFLRKFAAFGIFSAISTAMLTLAGFLGNGCLTYDNGLYQLEERSFLPIGGYTYDQVWTKYPSVNVKTYIFAFLMVMFGFLCLYLLASLVSAMLNLNAKLVNVSSLLLLGVVVAIVLMAHTPNVVILGLVAVLFIADLAFSATVGEKIRDGHQMA